MDTGPKEKFFRVSVTKNIQMLSPTNGKQRIPKAHDSDRWFLVSKEKSSLEFCREGTSPLSKTQLTESNHSLENNGSIQKCI